MGTREMIKCYRPAITYLIVVSTIILIMQIVEATHGR